MARWTAWSRRPSPGLTEEAIDIHAVPGVRCLSRLAYLLASRFACHLLLPAVGQLPSLLAARPIQLFLHYHDRSSYSRGYLTANIRIQLSPRPANHTLIPPPVQACQERRHGPSPPEVASRSAGEGLIGRGEGTPIDLCTSCGTALQSCIRLFAWELGWLIVYRWKMMLVVGESSVGDRRDGTAPLGGGSGRHGLSIARC
ncbi:hypothetical protein IWZ00DRAFT_78416 [Phyllosticta capitalensis]|uniref:uncharacterized protein n=1 Tax=Phyllosticta capitalensis TaxID=121624 RepID=UPI00312E67FC